jgi:type VI secretion system secreted protein Hcp
MNRSRALKVAVPTAAALIAGGAVALGAIPASDGTIHACYVTGGAPSGALRIVDEGVQCEPSETAITWNQRGPAGPAGPTGPTGDTGPSGSGDTGSSGSDTGSLGSQAGGPSADIFLKVDGIPGESTDDKHKGEIDIEAFTFSANRATSAGGSGKVKFAPFRFLKVYDASSPKLLQAAASGRHIKSATLSFRRSGDSGDVEFLTYKLSDILVSVYQQGGANLDQRALGSLEDEIGFSPGKVQVTEKTTTATGQSGPVVTASWDLKHNRQ